MIEFYAQIKWVHVAAIMASGTLFALRGACALAGMRWPMYAPVRYLSYTIDTVLLTAALMLLTILPGALFANGWLTVKVVLLVVYIVLGILALRTRRHVNGSHRQERRRRALFYVAALLVYLQIYCIARAHHPLGAVYLLSG
ncbi:SirB2 family protein [Pseudoxanthomonas koreensis]|uniref:SirB2 family protein n=1 Tax=Pseudoxanthomonas koreensis TaxID=266061 RepID=UPI0035A69E84